MYAFLAELVPDSLRGEERGRGTIYLGAISLSIVEYEHVMIIEAHNDNQPFDNKITVQFKSPACQQPTAH